MVDDFKKIQEEMANYIKKSLPIYFSSSYDPIIEYQVAQHFHKIVHQHLKDKYPDFPIEYLPQFRIRRVQKEQMMLQLQEHFNDIKGWRYIGTIGMPPGGETHDIYIRVGYGMEEFTLMTKFGDDTNDVNIGGYKAAAEYEAQIMTPLSVAYDYALTEGEI